MTHSPAQDSKVLAQNKWSGDGKEREILRVMIDREAEGENKGLVSESGKLTRNFF